MNNKKKVLAILGVIFLLLLFCLPMIFAFGNGENSQRLFRISLGLVITVPVLAYICLMAYQMWKKRQLPADAKIKNVVFDVGMVLIDFQWKTYLESFGFSKETEDAIANAVFKSEWWNERDKGEFEEAYYVDRFVENAPEYEEEIRKVMEHADQAIVPFDYAETWVRYLKEQGYQLYILSNLSHFMRDRTKDRLPFLKYMDGTLFSCDVHMIKPDSGIYRLLLKTYHLKPEETVFFDDREDNCEAAKKEGMHGIVFRSLKEADQAFRKISGSPGL